MFAYGVASVVLVLHLGGRRRWTRRASACSSRSRSLGDVALSLAVTTRADRVGPPPDARARRCSSSPRRARRSRRRPRSRSSPSQRRSGSSRPSGQRGRAVPPDRAGGDRAGAPRPSGAPRCSPGTSSPAPSRPRRARSPAACSAEALQRAGVAPLAELPAPLRRLRRRPASPSPCSRCRLSPAVEARRAEAAAPRARSGSTGSRGVVLRLSALFSLDAFAGGFVVQSFVAWWFHRALRRGAGAPRRRSSSARTCSPGVSALSAAAIARRFGLVEHDGLHPPPVERAPRARAAHADAAARDRASCSLRFSISQMDVPTRQSYTMAVVDPDERSAAAGRHRHRAHASARRSRRSPRGRSTRAPRSRASRSSSRVGSRSSTTSRSGAGSGTCRPGTSGGAPRAPLEARARPGYSSARVKRTSRPLTVVALLLGLFLAAMEMTVVSTAMPTVVAELGGLPLYAWAFAGLHARDHRHRPDLGEARGPARAQARPPRRDRALPRRLARLRLGALDGRAHRLARGAGARGGRRCSR